MFNFERFLVAECRTMHQYLSAAAERVVLGHFEDEEEMESLLARIGGYLIKIRMAEKILHFGQEEKLALNSLTRGQFLRFLDRQTPWRNASAKIRIGRNYLLGNPRLWGSSLAPSDPAERVLERRRRTSFFYSFYNTEEVQKNEGIEMEQFPYDTNPHFSGDLRTRIVEEFLNRKEEEKKKKEEEEDEKNKEKEEEKEERKRREERIKREEEKRKKREREREKEEEKEPEEE